jgi:hypothetical protein
MRLNRKALLASAAGAILTSAVLGVGVVVYAQQVPMPLQLSQAPEPTQPAQAPAPVRKPVPKPQKLQPRQEAQGQPKGAQAQPKEAPAQPSGATAQPSGAAAQAAPPDVFEEHAREGKIVTCAKVFDVLGRGVAVDSAFTARTQWDANAGDAHSIQSVVALTGGSANPAQRGAGIVFAAPVGRACEGTLVRVTPTSDNCQALAAQLTKINGQSGAVGDLPLIALPNGAQVMLVPFGNACVAVTTLRASG